MPSITNETSLITGGNNMYAVVVTGGKQYRVAEGDVIYVEKLEAEAEAGSKVVLNEVLAVGKEDTILVGDALADVKVEAEIVKHGKGKKIIVFKYKAKKGYRRKKGHRQPYTCLKINKIVA